MDRGAWRATVHGVAKSQTQLNDEDAFLGNLWNLWVDSIRKKLNCRTPSPRNRFLVRGRTSTHLVSSRVRSDMVSINVKETHGGEMEQGGTGFPHVGRIFPLT